MRNLALVVAGLLSACAAPAQVVQIKPGVYSLSVGAMGIFTGRSSCLYHGLLCTGRLALQFPFDVESRHAL